MNNPYQKLEKAFSRFHSFSHLGAIVGWDEAVNMPEGSGEARAKALSDLYAFMVESLKDPEILELIEKASGEDLSELQKANLREMRREWQNANVLDVDFVKRKSLTNMKCEQAWRKYREQNDWKSFLPLFEEVVELLKEEAHMRSEATGLGLYDSLLDLYEPGLRSHEVDEIFNLLGKELPAIRDDIFEYQKVRPFELPEGAFAVEKQKALGLEIMKHSNSILIAADWTFHTILFAEEWQKISGSPPVIRLLILPNR